MHKIEVTPAPCNVCGTGNTPESDGSRRQFVDFERDINWNDPLIICEDCIANAAGLVGMASKDTLTELKRELREKDQELHDTKAEIESQRKRAKQLGVEFVGIES